MGGVKTMGLNVTAGWFDSTGLAGIDGMVEESERVEPVECRLLRGMSTDFSLEDDLRRFDLSHGFWTLFGKKTAN